MTEDRADLRLKLADCYLDGRLHITANDYCPSLNNVSDISASGAGLDTNKPLHPGTHVSLRFSSDNREIGIHGEVVWCAANDSSNGKSDHYSFRTGISFNQSEPLHSQLFFRTVLDHANPDDGLTAGTGRG